MTFILKSIRISSISVKPPELLRRSPTFEDIRDAFSVSNVAVLLPAFPSLLAGGPLTFCFREGAVAFQIPDLGE
jgi:hypothetical protein